MRYTTKIKNWWNILVDIGIIKDTASVTSHRLALKHAIAWTDVIYTRLSMYSIEFFGMDVHPIGLQDFIFCLSPEFLFGHMAVLSRIRRTRTDEMVGSLVSLLCASWHHEYSLFLNQTDSTRLHPNNNDRFSKRLTSTNKSILFGRTLLHVIIGCILASILRDQLRLIKYFYLFIFSYVIVAFRDIRKEYRLHRQLSRLAGYFKAPEELASDISNILDHANILKPEGRDICLTYTLKEEHPTSPSKPEFTSTLFPDHVGLRRKNLPQLLEATHNRDNEPKGKKEKTRAQGTPQEFFTEKTSPTESKSIQWVTDTEETYFHCNDPTVFGGHPAYPVYRGDVVSIFLAADCTKKLSAGLMDNLKQRPQVLRIVRQEGGQAGVRQLTKRLHELKLNSQIDERYLPSGYTNSHKSRHALVLFDPTVLSHRDVKNRLALF